MSSLQSDPVWSERIKKWNAQLEKARELALAVQDQDQLQDYFSPNNYKQLFQELESIVDGTNDEEALSLVLEYSLKLFCLDVGFRRNLGMNPKILQKIQKKNLLSQGLKIQSYLFAAYKKYFGELPKLENMIPSLEAAFSSFIDFDVEDQLLFRFPFDQDTFPKPDLLVLIKVNDHKTNQKIESVRDELRNQLMNFIEQSLFDFQNNPGSFQNVANIVSQLGGSQSLNAGNINTPINTRPNTALASNAFLTTASNPNPTPTPNLTLDPRRGAPTTTATTTPAPAAQTETIRGAPPSQRDQAVPITPDRRAQPEVQRGQPAPVQTAPPTTDPGSSRRGAPETSRGAPPPSDYSGSAPQAPNVVTSAPTAPPRKLPEVSFQNSTVIFPSDFIRSNENAAFTVTLLSADNQPIPRTLASLSYKVSFRNFVETKELDVNATHDEKHGIAICSFRAPSHGEVSISVLYREQKIKEDKKISILRDLTNISTPIIIPCRAENQEIAKPYGVKVLGDDILISLIDKIQIQVHKFKPVLRGDKWESIGGNRHLANQFQYCRGLDILSSGEIVLVNNQKDTCMLIDQQGRITSFGREGRGDGEFNKPRGIVTLPGDDLAICDTDNSRVQIFARDKNDPSNFVHERTIGDKNPNKDENLLYCLGVAYCPLKKELAVTDTDHHRVQFFDLNGNSLGKIGIEQNIQFAKPSGVAYDAAGNLYVTDMDGHKLRIFDSNRNLINTLGGRGNGPNQMNGPRMMSVGWDGSIVVADLDNQRVLVF